MTRKLTGSFLATAPGLGLVALLFLFASAKTSQAQTGPYIDIDEVIPSANATLTDTHPVVGGNGLFYNSQSQNYAMTYKFFTTKDGGTQTLAYQDTGTIVGSSRVIAVAVSDSGPTDIALSNGHYAGAFNVLAHPDDDSEDIVGTAT